jgi:hypothetical protein
MRKDTWYHTVYVEKCDVITKTGGLKALAVVLFDAHDDSGKSE